MGFIFSLWRRIFGGLDTIKILEYRGVQCAICVLIVWLYEWLLKGFTWWCGLIIGGLVYLFWCRGHWPYFKCSTEGQEYIDSELAEGRKPAMNWLVEPICTKLGFEKYDKRWCFVGMFLRYTLWAIPVAFFIGWQFMLAGMAVAFIYNACFWIEFPSIKIANSPTNWAEILSGLIVGYGLL